MYKRQLWGLLELYAAHFSTQVLREAAALADRLLADFWDEERAGFYPTAHQGERLIARPKETYDGALPSGNAVAALALLRLGRLTAREEYRQAAQRQLAWLAGNLRDYPAGHTFALLALLEDMHPGRELVCTAAEGAPAELTALADRVSALVKTGENSRALARLAPFTADYPVPETGEAYYLCQDGACQEPVHDLASLRRRLGPSGARERPRV